MSMQYTDRVPSAVLGVTAGRSVTFNGRGYVDFVGVVFVSSAIVGTRQLVLRFKDAAGNVLMDMPAGATQAASLTRTYNFVEGIQRETAFVATSSLLCPLANVVLPAGGSLQVLDSADIDHTLDAAAIVYTFVEFP